MQDNNTFLGDMNDFFDQQPQSTAPQAIIRQTASNQNETLEKFYQKLEEMGMNLDELRPILDCEDNLLIMSGAGAGKTTALTLKIIRDLLSGTLMTVNTVQTTYGITHVQVPAKILVSTFLKTGAQDLQNSLREWCEKLGIVGVDYSSIQFKTIHAEVKDAITKMGAQVRILEDTHSLIRAVANKYSIRSINATTRSLSADEVNELATIMAYARNRLDEKRYEHPLAQDYGLNTLLLDNFLRDFKLYRQSSGGMDFEDLQEMLLNAMENNPNVEKFILDRYDYVFVDEFQDTSQLQYKLLKYYFKGAKRTIVVGDSDQCLVEGTLVNTDKGLVPIEDIKLGDRVKTGTGWGTHAYGVVDEVSKNKVSEDIVKITTESGKILRGTKNHIGFARLQPKEDLHLVYLMYREDIGYRIGITRGVRTHGGGGLANGLEVRLNQETADRAWIIYATDSYEDASYHEHYYSYKYGIPQYVFKDPKGTKEKSINLDSFDIRKLHQELNTPVRAMNLVKDLGIDLNHPHVVKRGTGRNILTYTMFVSMQESYGIHQSDLSVSTVDENYNIVASEHLPMGLKRVTVDNLNYYTGRKTNGNTSALESIRDTIINTCEYKNIPLEVINEIKLTDVKHQFMPFGNIQRGMLVPVMSEDGTLSEEEVISVELEHYEGYVYDISVPKTRNFSADGIMVHNCIYSWRGSDNQIILKDFREDFNPTILNLTTNYRCKSNILDSVKPSIMLNGSRHSKDLRAAKEGGEVNIIYNGDVNEMLKSIKSDLVRNYTVGILARTNADLLIPALILELDGSVEFGVSKSVNLNGRMAKQIIGMIDLVTKRVTNDFETLLRTFLRRYEWYEAEKLYNVLITNKGMSIYNIPDQDLRHSVPTLYPFLNGLRQANELGGVEAYLYILGVLENQVFTGSSVYVQKARDLTHLISKLIMEHDTLKDLSIHEIDILFRSTLPERLSRRVKYAQSAKVKLTTVHEAKGKEWSSVIIWNNVNGAFPNQVGNRELTKDEFEEERRVHYIAWTRAKEKLTVYTSINNQGTFLQECDLSYVNQTSTHKEDETKQVFKRKPLQVQTDSTQQAKQYIRSYIDEVRSSGTIADDRVANLEIVLNAIGEQDFIKQAHDEYSIGQLNESTHVVYETLDNICKKLADDVLINGMY